MDTGKGMNQKQMDSLFKIDTNMSTTGTEKEKGSGLGLVVCKEFIEKCKGKIWVQSEPEKGTTFSFSLKIYEP